MWAYLQKEGRVRGKWGKKSRRRGLSEAAEEAGRAGVFLFIVWNVIMSWSHLGSWEVPLLPLISSWEHSETHTHTSYINCSLLLLSFKKRRRNPSHIYYLYSVWLPLHSNTPSQLENKHFQRINSAVIHQTSHLVFFNFFFPQKHPDKESTCLFSLLCKGPMTEKHAYDI